ncbi:MAG: ABC transporter permease [Armatimonadaceae bacterium]
MAFLYFESRLAFRHLKAGGRQTALTVAAVAAGVVIVVFISSLIFGLRQRITTLITERLPHVTVTVEDAEPSPLTEIDGAEEIISSRIEQANPQRKLIENWQQAVDVVSSIPGVTAVAPTVSGQGFLSRGGKRVGVSVTGAEPERLDAITPLQKFVYAGDFLALSAEGIAINSETAEELGVGIGDRVRLTSSEERSESFLIEALYDTGQNRLGGGVYVTLRSGQSLFATGTAVQSVLVKVQDLFAADRIAGRIRALLPYDAESWSQQNPDAVASLGAQAASAYLVSGFSLIAAGFAIASILIVSVVQKGKQIGILKSMGATSRQILIVFTLEGLGIALVGSTVGALLGSGVVWGLSQIRQTATRIGGEPESLFPAQLSWEVVVIAMVAATISTVIAAIFPARQAASLDPVEVMR